jgi:Ca2+-binding RTX toxin-like protein
MATGFRPTTLVVTGDGGDDLIFVGRTATGELAVDGAASKLRIGKAGSEDPDLVTLAARGGNDQIVLDTGAGPLPALEVSGGGGMDVLTLLGSGERESVEISAAGSGARIVSQALVPIGEPQPAPTQVKLDGIETVRFRPGAGGDEVLVANLAGSGVQRVEVDLAGGAGGGDGAIDIVGASAGAGSDLVTLSVAGGVATFTGLAVQLVASGVEAADRFFVDGGDGADLIDASAIAQRADMLGGAGADTLLGGAGNDVLQSMDGNDVVAGGGGDDFVSLADGDDRAIWAVGDGSDNVSGGAGSDRLEMTGSAGADVFSLLVSGGGVIASHGGLVTNLSVSGFETISIAAGTGADSIAVGALAGAGVQRVEIDLGSDGAADVLQIAGIAGGPVAVGGALVYTTSGGLQVVVTGFVDGVDQILPLFG